mgnify:FL=1
MYIDNLFFHYYVCELVYLEGNDFMNIKRAFEIVNNKEIYDVFYNNEPVWIQELNNNKATIGFMNFNEVENVNIEDLKE